MAMGFKEATAVAVGLIRQAQKERNKRKDEEWYHSQDETRFTDGPFLARSAAVTAGRTAYDGGAFWVARKKAPGPYGLHLGDDVIESLLQEAGDEVGEAGDDWPAPTPVQLDDLDRMLAAAVNGWLKAHGLEPQFFAMEKITEVPARKRRTKSGELNSTE